MLFKGILIALLLFVIISLFTAFYYLVRDSSSSKRIVTTLFVRVGISIFTMILLLMGAYFGWVTPHGFGQ